MLTLHEKLTKDFSPKLRYTHNIEQLEDEITCNDAAILFYDLDFLGAENALSVLSEIRYQVPRLTILPIISPENAELIPQIVSLQLFFYITAPLDYQDIKTTLLRALESTSANSPATTAVAAQQLSHTKEQYCFEGILGQSSSMLNLFEVIKKVSEDDFSTVLIRGESGTGKELVAKAIHQCSPRSKNNFVPVNCAAIPDELLESELFGYTKGAFTGATSNKIGRIQYADKGTLFLDEIGDMKPSLQAKLLRVLQEREFEPVGGFKTTPVDTRVLAATHCDLESLVEQGLFREDLYYRLSVIPIEIPPLHKRKEDIPLLIEKFIDNHTTKRNRPAFSFTESASQALLDYDWQGNVRELENLIQHMSVLHAGSIIHRRDLPAKIFAGSDNSSAEDTAIPQNFFHESAPLQEEDFLSLTETTTTATDIIIEADSVRPDFGNFATDIGVEELEEEAVTESITFPEIQWGDSGINFKDLVSSFENQLIITALQKSTGNKKEAAKLLGLKRTTLLEKIKKKGLQDCWKIEQY